MYFICLEYSIELGGALSWTDSAPGGGVKSAPNGEESGGVAAFLL